MKQFTYSPNRYMLLLGVVFTSVLLDFCINKAMTLERGMRLRRLASFNASEARLIFWGFSTAFVYPLIICILSIYRCFGNPRYIYLLKDNFREPPNILSSKMVFTNHLSLHLRIKKY